MSQVDFDDHCQDYKQTHDRNIRVSGEPHEYFDRYKLKCIQTWVMPQDAPRDVLDFGCGLGTLAALVANAYPHATVEGFDVSQQSILKAKDLASQTGNLTFRCRQDVSRKYDVILAANVFHHIPLDERLSRLLALKDMLKPDGRIVVFEHNPWNPLTRHAVNTCPFDRDVSLISCRGFVRMAEQAGLRVAMHRYIVFFPKCLRLLRGLEPRLGRVCLGAQYMLVTDG